MSEEDFQNGNIIEYWMLSGTTAEHLSREVQVKVNSYGYVPYGYPMLGATVDGPVLYQAVVRYRE